MTPCRLQRQSAPHTPLLPPLHVDGLALWCPDCRAGPPSLCRRQHEMVWMGKDVRLSFESKHLHDPGPGSELSRSSSTLRLISLGPGLLPRPASMEKKQGRRVAAALLSGRLSFWKYIYFLDSHLAAVCCRFRLLFIIAVLFVINLHIFLLVSHYFRSGTFQSTATFDNLVFFLFTAFHFTFEMVSWIGGLAARAVFVTSVNPETQRADLSNYTANTVAAVNTLQDSWYNVQTGIWDRAWWNSANTFTTLADFATLNRDAADGLNIGGIMKNTFTRAQGEEVHTSKVFDDHGLVSSSNTITLVGLDDTSPDVPPLSITSRQSFPGFINEFYDDEGWWALGLIRAYDVTGDQEYLDMAVTIFEDMQTGGNTYCDGGIFWNKDRKYVNAITNELFLSVAASLANRMPNRELYLDIARQQWRWFKASGMINSRGTINDGLNGNCENNGDVVWSYNQGVVLGGLVELSRATGNRELLLEAADIARAAINELSDDGILHDVCEPDCGADGEQFKGIFIRNLRYLQGVLPRAQFRKYILDNADSNWANNRDDDNKMGVDWSGPPRRISGPTHSSALDTLVGAVAVV